MRIAWVSRHAPLPTQIEELERLFGEGMELRWHPETFQDARRLVWHLQREGCRVAVVAPLSMIQVMLKEGKDILWLRAEMELVHEGECNIEVCPYRRQRSYQPGADTWVPIAARSQLGRHYVFKEFREIVRVEIITRPVRGYPNDDIPADNEVQEE